MQILINNSTDQLKWNLTLRKIKTPDPAKPGSATKSPGFMVHYEISETNINHSLFSNPLARGLTAGDCLNNFLAIEEDLLKSL